MKMVSAAKFGRAEKELKPARSFGAGAAGKLILISTTNIVHVRKILYEHGNLTT